MGLSNDEVHIIQIIATVSGFLSVMGALGLILSFALIKELRTYPSKLVIYLCLADLGASVVI